MNVKFNISNYKQKLLIFLAALFIALALQPKQTVYAEVDWAAWASSLVHSDGSSGGGGNTTIQNGVTYTRTGYLAYLLTADGAPVPGTQAVAFSSPGFEYLSGYSWYCISRKGGYTATSFDGGTAPWGCTPWTPSGNGSTVSCSTNEPQIKQWFQGMDGNNNANGVQFVYQYWGEEAATHFYNNDYIIVIETIMHFQYSKPGDSISRTELSNLAIRIINQKYDDDALYTAAVGRGYKMTDANTIAGAITYIKGKLVDAMIDRLEETMGSGTRVFVGPPVIGTVPNLLSFKASIGLSTNPFSSYTNKVAPFAEHAIADGVAERAGFQVWTGSTSSELSDADVQNYAVAMMIITANSTMQTTCDEPLAGSPHNPPKESEGKVTIVKSYRTKDPTGALIDDGTYSLGDLGTQIIIENEQVYQVVGWKTSTTTNTNITSLSWNPPSSVIQQGTAPNSVTLQPNETCLYVLLEKVEEEDIPEEDYNYLLSESSITRTVWFSTFKEYDSSKNMDTPYMYEVEFHWVAPSLNICKGHHYKI